MTNRQLLKGCVGAAAFVLAITWGPGGALAGSESEAYAARTASRPQIAPVVPATDYDQYFDLRAKLLERSKGGGVIGVGERIRDHGSSLRKDLIRKRTPRDVIDRSRKIDHGGGRGRIGDDQGGGAGDLGSKPPLVTSEPPFDTQPISVDYEPTSGPAPPGLPEPTPFALMGAGLASLMVFQRRKKG